MFSLSLLRLIEENRCSEEEEVIILGRIKMHTFGQCKLLGCYNRFNEYYDSANQAYLNPSSIYCNRFSLLNPYLQCLYQELISQETDIKERKKLIFDYCEFIFNSNTKMGKFMILIQRLDLLSNLTFSEKHKLMTFKTYIQLSTDKINSFIYDRKLNYD